jgi:hypothetical protein
MRGLNTSPLHDSDDDPKIRTNREDAKWNRLRKDQRESECAQLFTLILDPIDPKCQTEVTSARHE